MHSIQDVNKDVKLVLSVRHLHIQNQQQDLVKDLNFDLHAGETIAIVGESGSGKSVSSLAILGLLPEYLKITGEANLEGQNLLSMDQAQLRQVRGKNYW